MKNVLLSPLTYVYAGVFCLLTLFGAGELFAQSGAVPTITPIVDFSSVFTTIATTIGPIIVGAIGLGLSIWAVRFMFRLVKSMGRG